MTISYQRTLFLRYAALLCGVDATSGLESANRYESFTRANSLITVLERFAGDLVEEHDFLSQLAHGVSLNGLAPVDKVSTCPLLTSGRDSLTFGSWL